MSDRTFAEIHASSRYGWHGAVKVLINSPPRFIPMYALTAMCLTTDEIQDNPGKQQIKRTLDWDISPTICVTFIVKSSLLKLPLKKKERYIKKKRKRTSLLLPREMHFRRRDKRRATFMHAPQTVHRSECGVTEERDESGGDERGGKMSGSAGVEERERDGISV